VLQLDWKFTLADNDLRKVGAMCDLADINVRYPFLDDDLVDFSARVPANMKISRFRLRHFFKHAMKPFLPPEVLTKSKHGFGLPFGIWMKSHTPLQELAYDCLSDIGKRNIVQPAYLDKLINAHQSTHAHYYGEFIWVLMMLELWFRKHNINYEVADA
jgi:asparagine synthase (glutamine-hydrolysing)